MPDSGSHPPAEGATKLWPQAPSTAMVHTPLDCPSLAPAPGTAHLPHCSLLNACEAWAQRGPEPTVWAGSLSSPSMCPSEALCLPHTNIVTDPLDWPFCTQPPKQLYGELVIPPATLASFSVSEDTM